MAIKPDDVGDRELRGVTGGGAPRADDLSVGARADELSVGARVGRYAVEAHLGGAVYAARDAELDRHVVLELFPGSGQDAARTLAAARALAGLAHPNAVTVLEVGEHAGAVFIAFERPAGQPVGEWLASRPRRVDEIVQIFREAALGLAAAHAAGLVHGPLDEESLLVGPDGRARLTFGVARADRAGGRLRAADPGESIAADDQRSLAKALRAALDRSARSWLGRRVPTRVARAIERALSAEPGARWPSMVALAGELELPQRRLAPVLAASIGLAAVGGVALALLLRGGGDRDPCEWVEGELAGVWDGARRAEVERAFAAAGPGQAEVAASTRRALDRYARGWIEQRTALCRSTEKPAGPRRAAMTGVCLARRREFLGALAAELVAASPARLRNAVEAAGALPPIEDCAHSQHLVLAGPVSPASAARAAELGAELARLDARFALGDLAVAKRAAEIAGEANKLGDHVLAASAWLTVGLADRDTAKPAEELKPLYESLWAAEAAGDLVAIFVGWVRLIEGAVGAATPRDEVDRMVAHAEATLARIARIDQTVADRYRTQLLTARADVYDEYGSSAEAEALQREAIALMSKVAGGESTLEMAGAEHGLGQILIGAARYDEAIEVSRRALDRTRGLVGADHPHTMVRHFQLGWAHLMRGQFDPALAEVVACRRIARKNGATTYLGKLAILEAQIEQQRGRPEAARQALEGAIADGSAASLSPFQVHYYLGEIQMSLDQFAAAEREFTLALEAIRKVNPDHSDVSFSHAGIGMAQIELGRAGEAREHLEAAVKGMEAREHSERPLAEMRRLLAQALWATGERRRAHEVAGQARAFLLTLPPDLAAQDLGKVDRWLAEHPLGKAERGKAQRGKAQRGKAQRGKAQRGKAQRGKAQPGGGAARGKTRAR